MIRKLIVLIAIPAGVIGAYYYAVNGGVFNTPIGNFPGPNALTIFGLFGLGLILGLVLRGKN